MGSQPLGENVAPFQTRRAVRRKAARSFLLETLDEFRGWDAECFTDCLKFDEIYASFPALNLANEGLGNLQLARKLDLSHPSLRPSIPEQS